MKEPSVKAPAASAIGQIMLLHSTQRSARFVVHRDVGIPLDTERRHRPDKPMVSPARRPEPERREEILDRSVLLGRDVLTHEGLGTPSL